MTIRSRVLLAAIAVALVPLAVLGLGLRGVVSRAVTAQYRDRVDELVSIVGRELEREAESLRERLAALAIELQADNRLRALLVADAEGEAPGDRTYLLDYAGRTMQLAGLSMLQLQTGDPAGRILSSGHFRNAYDQLDGAARDSLLRIARPSLLESRRPDGAFLALAAVDTFSVAGRPYSLMGGVAFENRVLPALPEASDLEIEFVRSTDPTPAAGSVVGVVELPLVRAATVEPARILITNRPESLRALQERVDRWFAGAAAAGVVLAAVMAVILAARVARPLARLADRTREVDLDRLDVAFPDRGGDEVGVLGRTLNAMTTRLRASRDRVRDVERQVAVGELARQVNHDIKNGLVPIRNVVRHLDEVAGTEPDRLAEVFRERSPNLEASIAYLESLSANYARLYPRPRVERVDVNAVVEDVARAARVPGTAGAGTPVVLDLTPEPVRVEADPLMLRRVIENLVANGIESLQGPAGKGTVTVSTAPTAAGAVRVTIRDTGSGMDAEQFERAFDDFYTTRERGSGLGLSIVRRLVVDMNGSVRLETEPGVGTSAILEFPAAPEGAEG